MDETEREARMIWMISVTMIAWGCGLLAVALTWMIRPPAVWWLMSAAIFVSAIAVSIWADLEWQRAAKGE